MTIRNNTPSLETGTINREYKSTVFSLLFRDKNNLLSLYNALNDSCYENPRELEIVTLENAIYMAMKNDNAFVFENGLHLYEHQSTPNPNLPLRDLFYVAREYEKLIIKKSLYSRKAVKIPAPHFVVFYNGIIQQPEKQILRLSDLYEIKEEEPMLELKVRFLNINQGYNEELKHNCRSLSEYMLYVERIRSILEKENIPTAHAVERAVNECIRENILRNFLMANRKEVVSMSIFEYDEEKELKLLREAEYQAGVEDGRKEGFEDGKQESLAITRKESLKIIKEFTTDFETVYEKVKNNSLYLELSKEEIEEIFDLV